VIHKLQILNSHEQIYIIHVQNCEVTCSRPGERWPCSRRWPSCRSNKRRRHIPAVSAPSHESLTTTHHPFHTLDQRYHYRWLNTPCSLATDSQKDSKCFTMWCLTYGGIFSYVFITNLLARLMAKDLKIGRHLGKLPAIVLQNFLVANGMVLCVSPCTTVSRIRLATHSVRAFARTGTAN